VVGNLDDLRQQPVRRQARNPQARRLQPVAIAHVDLVAVAVALGDRRGAIDFGDVAAGRQFRLVGADPHGAAEIAAALAHLEFVAAHPFGHQPDHRLGRLAELGGAGVRDAGEVPRRLDAGHLHAEADAEIRHVAGARKARGADLALRPALAEAARHQDAVHVLEERRGVLALEDLRLDPLQVDPDLVGDAAVDQRLLQRLVGVEQAGVLAHDGDRHLAFRVGDAVGDFAPPAKVGLGLARQPEGAEHLAVEAFRMIGQRHVVDRVHVQRLDDGRWLHVAEQRDLAALGFRDRPVGAAQQDVGLDADRAQFLDRVLGRLGLELAGRRE
jgi:hypothetical protein